MKVFKWLPAIATLIISSTVLAARPNDVSVSHYEPLQRLSMHSADSSTLSFDALGRTFDLQLEPNERLLSSLSREARDAGVAPSIQDEAIPPRIEAAMWSPVYPELEPA